MKLSYTLAPADFVSLAAFELRSVPIFLAWLGSLIWGLLFAALLVVSGEALPKTLFIAVVAFICLFAMSRWQRREWIHRNYSAGRVRGLAGEQHIEITEECLRETGPNRDVAWQWEDYSSIRETPTHVFIKPTPINTVVVPATAFTCESERSELVALVRRCIATKKT